MKKASMNSYGGAVVSNKPVIKYLAAEQEPELTEEEK